MSDKHFTASTAVKEAGITYRQLDHWCRTGLVVAAKPAKGSGSQRAYSEHNISMLKLVKWLGDAGLDHALIRRIIKSIENADNLEGYLIVSPDQIALKHSHFAAMKGLYTNSLVLKIPTV